MIWRNQKKKMSKYLVKTVNISELKAKAGKGKCAILKILINEICGC